MFNYSHVSTFSSTLDATAQSATLKLAVPHEPSIGPNRAAVFHKTFDDIEERDNYESDENMCNGNFTSASHLVLPKASNHGGTGLKRSASVCEENNTSTETKRARGSFILATTSRPSICSILPEVLWVEIFSFLHPADLGRQSRTCKIFKKYLEDESIWRRSRERYLPDHPEPFFGLTEWEMLCVMWGAGCMLCEKGTATRNCTNKSTSIRASAVVYWPFRVRCCKGCLEENTTKEFTLLSSMSFPAALLPALPFGIVDLRNNWISNPAYYLPNIGLTKIYWNADIRDILEKYQATDMGAQEECLKGPEGEVIANKLDLKSVGKFEKLKIRQGSSRGTGIDDILELDDGTMEPQPVEQKHDLPQKVQGKNTGEQSNAPKLQHQSESHLNQYTSTNPFNGTAVKSQTMNPGSESVVKHLGFEEHGGFRDYPAKHSFSQCLLSVPIKHSSQEAVGVKAKRRRDIEIRCLRMVPSLTPGLLVHMPAFQAAVKIAVPLSEHAWESLKIKLLEQIPGAEEKEGFKRMEFQKVQQRHEERKALEQTQKEEKERKEREWNDLQIPVRERLGVYADEIIKTWAGIITKETVPKFTVDVLNHCRCRFYEENPYSVDDPHHINPLETTTRVGQATLEVPTTRRLTLENMKFVFDNKIRPYTDHFGRELFHCNGCEYNPKFYAFEGVIQHYAAKHTSHLSVGPIVVHWKTDWPAKPPFNLGPLPAGVQQISTAAVVGPAHSHANERRQPQAFFQGTIAHQPPSHYVPTTLYAPPTLYHHTSYSDYNYRSHQQKIQETPHLEHTAQAHSVFLEQLAKDAREAWFQLSGIKDLPSSVRTYYVISKTIINFRANFSCEPSLAVFIESLKEYASLKPIKNANGLLCLECHKNPPPPTSDGASRVGRLFTFSALLQHFETVHILRNRAMAKPDWKTAMVKLPEMRLIGMIRQAQGLDQQKYMLLRDVFPLAFSLPFPEKSSHRVINCETRGPKPEYCTNQPIPPQGITVLEDKGSRFEDEDRGGMRSLLPTNEDHAHQDLRVSIEHQYPTHPPIKSPIGYIGSRLHRIREESTKVTCSTAIPHGINCGFRYRSPSTPPEPSPRQDFKPVMTAAEQFLENFLRSTDNRPRQEDEVDENKGLLSSPRAPKQIHESSLPRLVGSKCLSRKVDCATSTPIHNHNTQQLRPSHGISSKHGSGIVPVRADDHRFNQYSSIDPDGQNILRFRKWGPGNSSQSRYPSSTSQHIDRLSLSRNRSLQDDRYSRQRLYSEKYKEHPHSKRDVGYDPKISTTAAKDYQEVRREERNYCGTYWSHRPPVVYPISPISAAVPPLGYHGMRYDTCTGLRSRDQLSPLPHFPAQYSRYLSPQLPVTEVSHKFRSISAAPLIGHSSEDLAIPYTPKSAPVSRDYNTMGGHHRTISEYSGKAHQQPQRFQIQNAGQQSGGGAWYSQGGGICKWKGRGRGRGGTKVYRGKQ